MTSKQQDKQNIAMLEKKVQEERKLRASLEAQLASERKARKADEAAAAARAVAMATAARWVKLNMSTSVALAWGQC